MNTCLRLFLLTVVLAGPVYAQDHEMPSGNYYALLFAGDVYEHWGDLINPIHDARTLGNELQEAYGFEVDLVENPSQEVMLAKIREYAERTYGDYDHLLIFYAGHGKFDEIDGEGYIVSSDSKPDDETNLSYIPYSQLRTRINSIPSKHILLVLDACFGGTFDTRVRGSDDPYDDVTRAEFIARKMSFTTRRYITSGGKEYVPDGRPGHHSPFMRRLLEALRTYGGSDAILTLGEIQPTLDYVDPLPIFGEFGDNEPGSDFLLIARNADDTVAELPTSGPATPDSLAEPTAEETTRLPPETVNEASNASPAMPPAEPVVVEDDESTTSASMAENGAAEDTTEALTEQLPEGPSDASVQDTEAEAAVPEDDLAIDSTYAAATNTLVEHISTIMGSAKESVPPELRHSATFLEAVSLEERGQRLYGAGLYTKAAVLFDEAKAKYEEAARVPAPKADIAPGLQKAIDGFVAMLQNSLDAEDSGGMGAMFYLDRDWTAFFAAVDSLTAVIRTGPVQGTGGAVTLSVEVDLTYLDADAQAQEETLRHRWILHGTGDDWLLTKVEPQE